MVPQIVSAMPNGGSFKTNEIERVLVNLLARSYLLII
jgi:hypothetical protein